MDDLAFRAAIILIGNNPNCEGFEVVVPSAKSSLAFSILFHVIIFPVHYWAILRVCQEFDESQRVERTPE